MAVDSIGAVGSSTGVASNATIGQDDFLRILLAQLRFQDPLKPVDNQQFVAQLAQFSALEINRQQSEKIDTLLAVDTANQAIALMSKKVQTGSAQGGVIGTVSAVSFESGEPLLDVSVGGTTNPPTPATTVRDVRLSDIIRVLQP